MSVPILAMSRREDLAGGSGRERLNSERSPRPSVRALRRACTAHGTGPRARRLQDIESDTGYDTRRRVPDGARARMSQTERAFAPGAQLGQGSEVVLGCEILNRMIALGRPVSYRLDR